MSWVNTASKANILGAEAEERLWAALLDAVSQRVSCFLRASTLRNDMDSDVSWEPWVEQIRTITLTCGRTGKQRGDGGGGHVWEKGFPIPQFKNARVVFFSTRPVDLNTVNPWVVG